MEIASTVLRKLTCENCEGHLSCGPVLMLATGKNRCGRCSMPDDEAGTRNLAYEELARLVRFPCRYEENGCGEKVQFQHCRAHEEACAFRQYLCPVADSGKCDWTGVRRELLDHCTRAHPSTVVENSVTLEHNIAKPSLESFLLAAFEVLFLVQTKVCVASRTIYHSVRLIGNAAAAAGYEYELNIQNDNSKIAKLREVAPAGCLALQMNSSIAVAINTLLSALGDFQGTTFTLTVRLKKKDECAREQSMHVQCANCHSVTEPVYQSTPDWLCWTCSPARQACANASLHGCTYTDTEMKCRKHQHFCAHGEWCIMCSLSIGRGSPDAHYARKHGAVTHNAGDTWTTLPRAQQWHVVIAEFGKALCFLHRHGYKLFLYIRAPLHSAALYKFKCLVTVSHPITGHAACTWTADRQYFFAWDWELNTPDIDNTKFSHKETFNINIDFIKTKDVTEL